MSNLKYYATLALTLALVLGAVAVDLWRLA